MGVKFNWDALGIAASVACAIHCALLPLVVSSIPLFGVELLDNATFEYVMIAVAFALGVYSLQHGYKKHHHSWWPIGLFTLGIACLVAKVIWHELHLWFLLPAVLAIVAGHWLNYKLCRVHNHAHSDDCNH
ncbi:MAG TPA: MerC domain-containing protein [Chitinophagaceae bacterium]|nr:MerC domain-containing protein [Chitinophagaceae bacterium]HAN39559.1 MerC domain-containing protein [Chitinophagaceae bacterium]